MRGRASLAILTAVLMLSAPLLSACGDPATTKTSDAVATPAAEQTPVMPEDAPPQEEADASASEAASGEAAPVGPATPCAEDIGAAAAAKLVQRCIAVSPATHPPCNARNECAAIQGEIDRSCAMYGPNETKPAECAA